MIATAELNRCRDRHKKPILRFVELEFRCIVRRNGSMSGEHLIDRRWIKEKKFDTKFLRADSDYLKNSFFFAQIEPPKT